MGISTAAPDTFVGPLETLLVHATEHEPSARPTMREFAAGLAEWLRIQGAFRERNTLEWVDLQRKIFPFAAPDRAEWTELDDIVLVLNLVGQRSNMNHLFFPSGGGMDLEGATRSAREAGCIELDVGVPALLKPRRLLFENLGADAEWNYFWLEASDLAPSGAYPEESRPDVLHEEVLDLGGREYVDRIHWDYGEYQGERLPEGAELILRYFRGSFVIFQKASTYNQDSATYDARHNRVTADQFREYIQRNLDRLRSHASGQRQASSSP